MDSCQEVLWYPQHVLPCNQLSSRVAGRGPCQIRAVPWEHSRQRLVRRCSGCLYAFDLDEFDLIVPVLLAVLQGENSELACCNMESTVVGAMWGAGSEESISRTLGDGVRIAYHLHAYDNSINQSAVVVNSVLEFGTHARSSAT